MFITNRTLPRRTFLRGLGTTLALPFLESMLPARGAVAAAKKIVPTRFVGAFVPHGAAPGYWIPDSSAPGFKFPFIYEPLEPFRKQTVLTSGMWSQSSENPPGVTGADHFVAAAYLTGVKPKKTTGADIEAGPTHRPDHRAADRQGPRCCLRCSSAWKIPVRTLRIAAKATAASTRTRSPGRRRTRPLPMEINPQVVFERMFGDGSSPELRTARRERQASILDSVTGSLNELMPEVSHEDRVRLEQYMEDVREIERRLDIAAKASTDVPNVAVPYGVPESFHEHIQIQFDLLALALQADITRVATVLYARDLTGRVYPESGTDISFHGGSHHAEDPGRVAQFARLNRYHVQMLAYLVKKLADDRRKAMARCSIIR